MIPVYVDVHIHTSENPNSLNKDYDVTTLLKNVKTIGGDNFLIALSDHNTINKDAYLNLLKLTNQVEITDGGKPSIKKRVKNTT